jgi:uncharacterized lipoprotein YmbA
MQGGKTMNLKYWPVSSAGRPDSIRVRGVLAAAAAAVLILAAGCASAPEVRYHDIKLEAPEATAGDALGSLHLERITVPAHLDELEIFYRTSAYDAGYYTYHHWIRPLSASLESELLGYLRASGRFSSLTGTDERPSADRSLLTMRLKVLEFAENGSAGDVWNADVAVLVRLKQPATGRSRETTLRRSVPLNTRNAAGTVEALNRALAAIAADTLETIESFAGQ